MLVAVVKVEDDFRPQLDARIARYVAQRDELQAQLVELNHALNSLDKRLEAAIEMYRLEFGQDPDAAKDAKAAKTGSQTGRRRRKTGGTSWNEIVVDVLTDAGTPLHLTELWRRIQARGFETGSKDPLRSLASVLVRHPAVHRTGRNVYALKSLDPQQQEPIEGLAVEPPAPVQEGEAA